MRKLLNIFISMVFLISFIGIQVNKHYSKGKLYSVAVFQDAESCCSDMGVCEINKKTNGHCAHQAKDDFSCKNTTELFKISDVFIMEKFSLPNAVSLDLFTRLLFNFVETNSFSTITPSHFEYSWLPPGIVDFQAELGVFLC